MTFWLGRSIDIYKIAFYDLIKQSKYRPNFLAIVLRKTWLTSTPVTTLLAHILLFQHTADIFARVQHNIQIFLIYNLLGTVCFKIVYYQ